ncbi:CAP domain-containing protein [Halobellus sp. Atlit-31R]|nr:CAP domain-containing protein [Halobellus sp. Atlit-31R]
MMRLLLALLVISGGVVIATPIGPVQYFDSGIETGNVSAEAVDDAVANASETLNSSVNETEVRYEVHKQVNEERSERGLPKLEYSEQTATAAEDHSDWMADELRLDHSGNSQYSCRPVGENIAYTYVSQDIRTENGTVNHYGDEEEIASGLVRSWMNSEGHRKNILQSDFRSEGIGIAIVGTEDGDRVYATQALCG